ncbi:hypothetical protein PSEUBRA_004435 [Kalmanozyma brasiliensis GHG001]|uniref:Uncharacterized protein n=1 Tax=Kalmanozyma brasiliensis (strain GHG001) TaxID=1365824 RepID=V5GKR6_KALBG|nr:uncharacterized protein PSEUBRA_004435 [Kalmanozyma brasiliensis GHG001]EST06527.1 hypothetical protein PSEUBRA_004435 [Kalmanozyma brasiliensis GHG001]
MSSKLPTSSSSPAVTFRSFSSTILRHDQDEKARSESAAPQAAEVPTNARTKSARLLAEEVADAEPTLEYLDSLKPRARRLQPEQQRPRRGTVNPFAKASSNKNSAENKQWERTRVRINASFTRDQLASLGRAAKLPGSYARTIRKDELVRRIMVHRFGMEDARERADREKREELEKRSVHIAFRPSEMYLLLARGSGRVRQEASNAQVAILPKAPAKENAQQGNATEKLGFWIRGKDQGIERMTKWVDEFKHTIKHRDEEVVLSAQAQGAETSDAGVSEVLPAELVRFISQLSRCFMEASPIENGKVTLSLAYLDERDAHKAVLLLRQYHAQSAEAMQRIGAAAYSNQIDSERKYSMLPFVPNEPTPWTKQADDLLYGSQSDISFRVASVPELNAFSMLSTARLPTMQLEAWSNQGDLPFSDPFRALFDSVSASASFDAATKDLELSAELGYVLFDSNGLSLADEDVSEPEVLSRLSDPLAPPRPGTWPISDVLSWTRQLRTRFGREASRFVPATLFRSQKNISLDIWLERQGWAIHSEGTTTQTTLVYQSADEGCAEQGTKLEVVLTRRLSETGGRRGWQVHEAKWVAEAQGDLMVPDKGADVRLGARTMVRLEGEELGEVVEALDAWNSSKAIPAKVDVEAAEAEVQAADAEEEVDNVLGGETEVVEAEAPPTEAQETAKNVPAKASALPPSMLNLKAGKMALESVTRARVQTYMQRSAMAAIRSQAAATAEPEVAVSSAASEAAADQNEAAESPSVTVESSEEPVTTAGVSQDESAPSDPSTSSDASAETTDDSIPPTIAEVAQGESAETATPADAPVITNDSTAITTAEVAQDAPIEAGIPTDAPAPNESTPITTADNDPRAGADTHVDSVHAAEQASAPLSPLLIRNMSQDVVTETTAESLRLVWRLPPSSPQTVPEWQSLVSPISALLDRHDLSTR